MIHHVCQAIKHSKHETPDMTWLLGHEGYHGDGLHDFMLKLSITKLAHQISDTSVQALLCEDTTNWKQCALTIRDSNSPVHLP